MNVLLRDTEEYIDGKHTGSLGLVLIRYVKFARNKPQVVAGIYEIEILLTCSYRCNNILWMGSAADVEMTDLGLK